jgi:peptide deformylase
LEHRVAVIVDVGRRTHPEGKSTLLEMVNPVIVERAGHILWREGCLSVPGVSAEVERSARLVVEYLDRDGQIVRHSAEGLEAVAIQHELDHLDGVLYFDRLGVLEQKLTLQDYDRARAERAAQAGETESAP